jgi:hypothetical protein
MKSCIIFYMLHRNTNVTVKLNEDSNWLQNQERRSLSLQVTTIARPLLLSAGSLGRPVVVT